MPLEDIPCPSIKAWSAPDDRVPLVELLAEYAAPIQAITVELDSLIKSHPVEDPIQPDPIFVLRHLLSRKSTSKAVVSIRKALEHRRSQQHLALALQVAAGDAPSLLKDKSFKDGFPCTITTTTFGDLVEYMEHGHNDAYWQFVHAISPADFTIFQSTYAESAYQYLDQETRRRGYFVKVFWVLDFKHVNLITMVPEFWHLIPALSEFSALSSNLYPQMEAKTVLASSYLLSWAVSIVKPFLPESSFEKLVVQMTLQIDSIDGLIMDDNIGSRKAGFRVEFLRELLARPTSSNDSGRGRHAHPKVKQRFWVAYYLNHIFLWLGYLPFCWQGVKFLLHGNL